jgi:signal transduction histidine kinase
MQLHMNEVAVRALARVIARQEAERVRIAAEIHDDTIQAMTATSLRMQQLERHLTDPAQAELVRALEGSVRESIASLRRLMTDLRPAANDGVGVSGKLGDLSEQLRGEPDAYRVIEHVLSECASVDVRIDSRPDGAAVAVVEAV